MESWPTRLPLLLLPTGWVVFFCVASAIWFVRTTHSRPLVLPSPCPTRCGFAYCVCRWIVSPMNGAVGILPMPILRAWLPLVSLPCSALCRCLPVAPAAFVVAAWHGLRPRRVLRGLRQVGLACPRLMGGLCHCRVPAVNCRCSGEPGRERESLSPDRSGPSPCRTSCTSSAGASFLRRMRHIPTPGHICASLSVPRGLRPRSCVLPHAFWGRANVLRGPCPCLSPCTGWPGPSPLGFEGLRLWRLARRFRAYSRVVEFARLWPWREHLRAGRSFVAIVEAR